MNCFLPRLLRLTLIALLLGLSASPAAAALGGDSSPDEVLVRFAASASASDRAACLHKANAAREREIAPIHVLRLKVPPGQVTQAIARLQACPGILYAEPNGIVHATVLPDDPAYSLQYGLVNIRAPEGWDLSTGSASVTIAIVDSGIDLVHPDLSAKTVPGYDFVNNDAVPQDDFGHGTHVAGIAAASTNNAVGIAGVSWGGRLMPVKVLDSTGNGSFAEVLEGITWAADHGAKIINMSFGGTSASLPQALQDAVDYAYGKGVLLVAAAGNDARNENFYPANLAHVLSITATDQANLKAPFANFGPHVALAAPGVSIYSTLPGGAYGTESGTSMATPFVSGLAAILAGLPGNASPEQITQELETTALDLGPAGRDDDYGFGLIQANAAINSVRTLTVTKVGSGTVTSTPAGMRCGTTCTAAFVAGTPVTLTAEPFGGSTFLGWSDPACPGTAPCTLTLTSNTAITASFTYSIALPLIFK